MKRITAICAALTMLAVGCALSAFAAEAASPGEAEYVEYTQAELCGDLEKYGKAKVSVKGPFLFTGSDFCYQVRKTTINTRDYLCFALGPMNLVRFYLKKDHEQVPQLMSAKKGSVITAHGTFDYLGKDYKFIIVDKIELEPPK